MSIQASLEESMRAIRMITALEAEVERAADRLRTALLSGHKVLTCGNGGSAADSSHFATEIACRFIQDRRPFPAISLSAEGGLLTATGNDYSFDEVFARQVRAYGVPGDVLVALSTSGRSPNVVRALEQARAQGVSSIVLLGRDGGRCRGLGEIELLIPHDTTARIQEAHKVIIHLLCELIEPDLQKAS
jgi:phosphoheptose isomerase